MLNFMFAFFFSTYFNHERIHERREMIKKSNHKGAAVNVFSLPCYFLYPFCVFYFHVCFQRSNQFKMPNKNKQNKAKEHTCFTYHTRWIFFCLLCFFSVVCERKSISLVAFELAVKVYCLYPGRSGSLPAQSLMQSWWQLFFCLLPCQGPSNIMNVWRQCCGYIWSLFERFGVCRGIRLHSSKAVSHRQCLQNEICLLGFLIPLAVIVLVNSDAFNKGALAFPDSRPSWVSCRSFEEEYRSGLSVQMKCVIFRQVKR